MIHIGTKGALGTNKKAESIGRESLRRRAIRSRAKNARSRFSFWNPKKERRSRLMQNRSRLRSVTGHGLEKGRPVFGATLTRAQVMPSKPWILNQSTLPMMPKRIRAICISQRKNDQRRKQRVSKPKRISKKQSGIGDPLLVLPFDTSNQIRSFGDLCPVCARANYRDEQRKRRTKANDPGNP